MKVIVIVQNEQGKELDRIPVGEADIGRVELNWLGEQIKEAYLTEKERLELAAAIEASGGAIIVPTEGRNADSGN